MRIYGETRSLFFVVIRTTTLLILYVTKLLNMKKGISAVHIYTLTRAIFRNQGSLKLLDIFLLP